MFVSRKNRSFPSTIILLMLLLFHTSSFGEDYGKQPISDCENTRQFTFSWSMLDQCDMKPRGGTTKGVKTTLDPKPHPGWLSLQEEGLSTFEKDRRAILAMAGAYRVSFDFLETVGYTPNFKPTRPYQSWGTEYVYVVEDKKKFISLQHVMVMYFKQDDGSESPPMVMKHWRQDWHYEKRNQFVYAGNNYWNKNRLSRKEAKGTWSQSVFQVDDSPRYESQGKWQHQANFSTWKSGKTWRPLPRREGSVRSDYQVLEGTNRHTILPSGWVQEEENLKLVLTEAGKIDPQTPYLSKELGVARYEKIINFDFSPGDEYWKKSSPFWADVRYVWQELIDNNKRIKISKKVDSQFMFMPFFTEAQKVVDGGDYSSKEGRVAIRKMLEPFIELK
ncbi:MAG: DUF6607 family protein [Pseudomonadota bacterium]